MITHTLTVIPKNLSDIIITNHCIHRISDRFHLLIPRNCNNPRDLPHYLKKVISTTGRVNRKFEFSPFYVNKCSTKYNETIIIHTSICVFIAKWDRDNPKKLVIKTAVRRP